MTAAAADVVRGEPFDAIELDLTWLWSEGETAGVIPRLNPPTTVMV